MRSQAASEKSLQQLGFGRPPKVIRRERRMMSLVARQLLAAASGADSEARRKARFQSVLSM